jgi:hypothetical protein
VLFQLSMLPAKTLELIRKNGHVSSQFVDLVLRTGEGILMREAFDQSADTRLNVTVNTFAQFFPGGSGQGGVALKVCKAVMEKRGVSDGDFDLMRMAAVGHDVNVSGVDQAALAWFLVCDFAKGLRGKSLGGQLGGQGGAAFKAEKAEMAKHKVSEGDFVKMRMAAVGHDVDVSGVDQAALAWFLDSDFAKGLRGKSLGGQLGGQGGLAFKAAKAEMAKHKVSEGDFVKMRMAAIGHSADVSGVDQAALAWFLVCDFAKTLQAKARANKSGSDRQVHARTPAWLWREYWHNVGEGPMAVEANPPLLFSLPDLYTNDPVGFFDGLVQELLTTTSWRASTFGKENGVDKIRETIRRKTADQYGSHIPTRSAGYLQARLD